MANIWGGKNSSAITFKMFIYTVFGSLFMLIGFVFLFMRGQTADISALKETVALLPEGLKAFLFWGFACFCYKNANFSISHLAT